MYDFNPGNYGVLLAIGAVIKHLMPHISKYSERINKFIPLVNLVAAFLMRIMQGLEPTSALSSALLDVSAATATHQGAKTVIGQDKLKI